MSGVETESAAMVAAESVYPVLKHHGTEARYARVYIVKRGKRT